MRILQYGNLEHLRYFFCLDFLILIGLYLFQACVILQTFGPNLPWQGVKSTQAFWYNRILLNSVYRLLVDVIIKSQVGGDVEKF